MYSRYMRLMIFFSAFAIAAPLSAAFCQSNPEALATLQGASRTEKEGLLVLHVHGTPYQMGYQHGFLLKDRIKALYEDYLVASLREKVKTKKRFATALHYFQDKARQMERFIPMEYRQEMQGIADGSGMPYTDILVIHTFLDVISNRRQFARDVKTCTNFISLGNASTNQELIHGRNLSWPSRGILQKQAVVIFYKPASGNSFAAISWPGVCGVLTGLNDKGISFGETSVGTAESTLEGVPAFILFRSVLQNSSTLYDAIRVIASAQRTTGYTVMISDGKSNKACEMEFTAQHYAVRFPEHDFLVCTNHYRDPRLLATMRSVYPHRRLEDSSSYERLVRANELINKNLGAIDPAKARDFLRDAVLLTKGTLFSVVFQPQQLQFMVANGRDNIAKDIFVAFDLKEELHAQLPEKGAFTDPDEYYSYTKEPVAAERTLIGKTGIYRKYKVSYDSVIKTDFFDNKVYLTYYEPVHAQSGAAVLVVPHTAGGSQEIEGQFCENLAEDGIAAVILNMAYQERNTTEHHWLRKRLEKMDPGNIEILLRQQVIESRRAFDWLQAQPGVDPQRLGILGVSLGAIVAPIVTAVDGRVHSAMYLLGGGDLAEIIYNGEEMPFLRDKLVQQKISPQDFMRLHPLIDPLTFAFRAKDTPIVMCNSIFDTVIPRDSTVKLWQALNRPKIFWIPAAHYTAILFIGNTKSLMAEHFNSTLQNPVAQGSSGSLNLQAQEQVQVIKQNFLRRDLSVKASARYDTGEQGVKLGLLQEDMFTTPFFGGFDASGRREKDDRYKLSGEGLDLYTGLKISKKTKFTLRFLDENVRMKDVTSSAPEVLRYSAGHSNVADLDCIFERSSLDNRYYPTRGTFHSLEWDTAAPAWGSDFSFSRLSWQSRGYLTPGKFFTFMLRIRLGFVESSGRSLMVPYFERLFCGGASTVRGYRSKFVGPKDENNLPLGGDFLWVNNAEMRFPIYKKLTGAVFFDGGSVWTDQRDVRLDELRYGTGAGLRYITKWGVARADVGFRLNHESDQPHATFNVSFGLPF